MSGLLRSVSALFLAILFSTSFAFANTINVNTFDDEFNNDGDCSLREAVASANMDTAVDACAAGDGADTVVLQNGTYELNGGNCGNSHSPDCGDIDIWESTVVEGNGAVVDGLNNGDRVFEVTPGLVPVGEADDDDDDFEFDPIVVEFNDLTMQGGAQLNGGCLSATGFSFVDVLVTLNNVLVQNCFAIIGGGVSSFGVDMTLNESSVDRNFAILLGGGIASVGGGGNVLRDVGVNFIQDDDDDPEDLKGSLTLNDSTVNLNNSEDPFNEQMAESLQAQAGDLLTSEGIFSFVLGGGIFTAAAPLTMNDSEVNENNTIEFEDEIDTENIDGLGLGGGIFRFLGEVSINGSEVNGNKSLVGGGILSLGGVILFGGNIDLGDDDDDDVIEEEEFVPAPFSITDSTVDGNEAFAAGGGIFNLADMTAHRSTISNNRVLYFIPFGFGVGNVSVELGGGFPFIGGGAGVFNMYNFSGVNCTVSGNVSELVWGGGIAQFGLLSEDTGTFLQNCTVTNNTVENGDFGEFETGEGPDDNFAVTVGGGLAALYGPIYVRNTIVAANIDAEALAQDDDDSSDEDEEDEFAPDCYAYESFCGDDDDDIEQGEGFCGAFGAIISEGYNLLGDNTNCTFDPADGDQVGTGEEPIDPALEPLSNNGGSTNTHKLMEDSPAVDTANPGILVDTLPLDGDDDDDAAVEDFGCETEDQRTIERIRDGNNDGTAQCDIGAFELDGAAICKEAVITETLFQMDGSALDALRLGKRMKKVLKRFSGKNKLGKAEVNALGVLYTQNWVLTWSVPEVIKDDCTNANFFCVNISNVASVNSYIEGMNDMEAQLKKLARKLKKNGVPKKKRKRFIKRRKALMENAIAQAQSVPGQTSDCV